MSLSINWSLQVVQQMQNLAFVSALPLALIIIASFSTVLWAIWSFRVLLCYSCWEMDMAQRLCIYYPGKHLVFISLFKKIHPSLLRSNWRVAPHRSALSAGWPQVWKHTHTQRLFSSKDNRAGAAGLRCFSSWKSIDFYSFNSGALILSKWKHKGLTRAEPTIHLTSYCDVYLWRIQSAGTCSAVSAFLCFNTAAECLKVWNPAFSVLAHITSWAAHDHEATVHLLNQLKAFRVPWCQIRS